MMKRGNPVGWSIHIGYEIVRYRFLSEQVKNNRMSDYMKLAYDVLKSE